MKKSLCCLFSLLALTICGCSGTNSKFQQINKHTIKVVANAAVSFDDEGNPSVIFSSSKQNVHFFNNITVPYYNVCEYFKDFIDLSPLSSDLTSYSFVTIDHKIIITNSFPNESATIDFDAQTVTYTNYGGFLIGSRYEGFSTNIDIMGGEKYFVGDQTHDYVGPKEYKIDLSSYNMPIYFESGQGYLPFYLFRNIFQMNALFIPYFNGNYIYTLLGLGNSQTTLKTINVIREQGNEAYLKDNDLLQFNYDLLALTFDHVFSMKERESRIDGHLIKYFDQGAYKALEPFKEHLMSCEPNVSNDAMYEIFDTLTNDGGHSSYGSLNIFSSQVSEHKNVGEIGHTFNVMNMLQEARTKAGCSPSQVLDLDPSKASSAIGCYQEIDGVAFVTFDSFTAPTKTLVPENINETNYYLDTISLIHYSNKQIKEHNIKNVVIDLSCNGGGAVYTCIFASSWLSQGNLTFKGGNVKDGGYYESLVHADVNLNGEFDEGDYLDSSVKVYCEISNFSFSCGNMMPTLVADNSNAKFFGSRTGGGCCVVVGNYYTALGGTMRLSVMFNILRKESTKDNFITNENGVTPDFYEIPVNSTHAKDYYDRQAIVAKIKADI